MQGTEILEVEVDAGATEGAGSSETSIVGVAWGLYSEYCATIRRCARMDTAKPRADGEFAYRSGTSSTLHSTRDRR